MRSLGSLLGADGKGAKRKEKRKRKEGERKEGREIHIAAKTPKTLMVMWFVPELRNT